MRITAKTYLIVIGRLCKYSKTNSLLKTIWSEGISFHHAQASIMFLSSVHLISTLFPAFCINKSGQVWQGAFVESANATFLLFKEVTPMPCFYTCSNIGKEGVLTFQFLWGKFGTKFSFACGSFVIENYRNEDYVTFKKWPSHVCATKYNGNIKQVYSSFCQH